MIYFVHEASCPELPTNTQSWHVGDEFENVSLILSRYLVVVVVVRRRIVVVGTVVVAFRARGGVCLVGCIPA